MRSVEGQWAAASSGAKSWRLQVNSRCCCLLRRPYLISNQASAKLPLSLMDGPVSIFLTLRARYWQLSWPSCAAMLAQPWRACSGTFARFISHLVRKCRQSFSRPRLAAWETSTPRPSPPWCCGTSSCQSAPPPSPPMWRSSVSGRTRTLPPSDPFWKRAAPLPHSTSRPPRAAGGRASRPPRRRWRQSTGSRLGEARSRLQARAVASGTMSASTTHGAGAASSLLSLPRRLIGCNFTRASSRSCRRGHRS